MTADTRTALEYGRAESTVNRFVRILGKPPGGIFHFTVISATLGMMSAYSAPNGYVMQALVFALVWIVLVAALLGRAFIAGLAGQPLKRLRWLTIPAIAAVTFLLIHWDVPTRVRFAMSREALTRLAKQQHATSFKQSRVWGGGPVNHAGLYDVVTHQVSADGEVDFLIPGTFVVHTYGGFTYSPNGAPQTLYGSFVPLGNSWYELRIGS